MERGVKMKTQHQHWIFESIEYCEISYLARLTRAPTGWVSCRLVLSSWRSSSLSLTGAWPLTFSRLLTWLESGRMLRLSSRKMQEVLEARLRMNLSLNRWTTSW